MPLNISQSWVAFFYTDSNTIFVQIKALIKLKHWKDGIGGDMLNDPYTLLYIRPRMRKLKIYSTKPYALPREYTSRLESILNIIGAVYSFFFRDKV